MKFAKCSRSVDQVRPYMPTNYHVAEATDGKALVYGTDDHGWTMEDYVIPRLGSGMIAATQISKVDFQNELKNGEVLTLPLGPTYCGLCDAEAVKVTGNGCPLCATCAEAYELGQMSGGTDLQDLDY